MNIPLLLDPLYRENFKYLKYEYEYYTAQKLAEDTLYSLSEEANEEELEDISKVKSLISEDTWNLDPTEFYNSFMKSKHPQMLTHYSPEDFAQMKTYKVPGYDIGFALKQWKDGSYSEIVAVHNNDPRIKGIGKLLVKAAIRLGGRYLDHFDGMLSDLYGDDFSEYARYPYDPQYDPDGSFAKKYGTPDVIFRHHKSVQPPTD